jgi:hypothetical protein
MGHNFLLPLNASVISDFRRKLKSEENFHISLLNVYVTMETNYTAISSNEIKKQ